MKISTKLRYGLRAMIDLTIKGTDKPMLVQSIAERQQISKKYLEHLLMALKSAGLLRSIRGSKGGYILAHPPKKITVKQIAIALEGLPHLTDCVGDSSLCSRVEFCATRDFWKELTEHILAKFSSTTLADLVRKVREKEEFSAHMYYI